MIWFLLFILISFLLAFFIIISIFDLIFIKGLFLKMLISIFVFIIVIILQLTFNLVILNWIWLIPWSNLIHLSIVRKFFLVTNALFFDFNLIIHILILLWSIYSTNFTIFIGLILGIIVINDLIIIWSFFIRLTLIFVRFLIFNWLFLFHSSCFLIYH